MARGQLRHLARAHDHDGAVGQRAENLARQLHRRVADRNGHLADAGLRAHPLGHAEGAGDQAVQPAADRAAILGRGVGGLELAQNLRLADHHGIQAGGHAEQVMDGVAALVPVEVRGDGWRRRSPCDRPGRRPRWPAGRTASSVVTVISTRLQVERITASATPSRDFRSASAAGSVSSPEGQALAHLDGCGFVAHAGDEQLHGLSNRCPAGHARPR